MAVTRLKPLGNFRAAPVRVSTPEPIEIEGGVALLAEAPADPGSPSWPMVVTVNGTPRTRVTGTPAAGQFKVQTQTVIGANGQAANEYLPLLQFHESDEGLAGTCDYWQSGSVLTAQFFSTLVSFLTPLTGYADIGSLPPPTSAQTVRGRPGDIAFLTSGEMVYSDGASWMVFSGSTPTLSGGLTLGAAISMALDAGYVGPSLEGASEFGDVHSFATDAGYVLGVAADETFDAILGLTMDAVVAHVGADSHASAHGFEGDASWAGPSLTGDLTLGQSIAFALDATYAAGGGSAIFSETFNDNTLGQFAATTGVPTVSGGQLRLATNQAVRAAVDYSRGFYVEVHASLPLTGSNANVLQITLNNNADRSLGNSYRLRVEQTDDPELGTYVAMTLYRGATVIASNSNVPAVNGARLVRLEFPAAGAIVVRQDGASQCSGTDNTYSSFTHLHVSTDANSDTLAVDSVTVGAL